MVLKKILWWICLGLVIAGCILPFLRLSDKIYLVGFREVISVGPYEVKSHVFVEEVKDEMYVSGYFTYRTQNFSSSRCLLEVTIDTDRTKYIAATSPIIGVFGEADLCNSLDTVCPKNSEIDNEIGRLRVLTADMPIQDLTYNFHLYSEDGSENQNCDGNVSYTHKVRYRRISYYDRYMSIRGIQWFEKYLSR